MKEWRCNCRVDGGEVLTMVDLTSKKNVWDGNGNGMGKTGIRGWDSRGFA